MAYSSLPIQLLFCPLTAALDHLTACTDPSIRPLHTIQSVVHWSGTFLPDRVFAFYPIPIPTSSIPIPLIAFQQGTYLFNTQVVDAGIDYIAAGRLAIHTGYVETST